MSVLVENRRRWMSGAAVAAATVLLLGACGGDEDTGTRIVPADESVGGKSLQDLVTQYITNVIEVPLADSFIVDSNKCDMGLSTDDVYFAPTFSAPGETLATCTMRAGQAAIFIPAAQLFVESGDGDAADTQSLDELWTLVSSSVVVDGQDVSLEGRQVDTPVTTVSLVDGNLFEMPVGETKMISRAQAVVVDGLEVGKHEVVLAADFGPDSLAGSMKITLIVEE